MVNGFEREGRFLAVASRRREQGRAGAAVALAAQHVLLFGFAGVAAALSGHGLMGFARTSMGLRGPWPYLVWGALDGAAGFCAVLLMRRGARGEAALAPRLAGWGLVAASSAFNWSHAPAHLAARMAFALMPVIAAVLFEFSLREGRRASARHVGSLSLIHPAEAVRVGALLASNRALPAAVATQHVRAAHAAHALYRLRQLMRAAARRPSGYRSLRVRRAEHHAQAALARVGFFETTMAVDVLRRVQILTMPRTLADLDYGSPEGAREAIESLIAVSPALLRDGAKIDAPALHQYVPGGPSWARSHGLEGSVVVAAQRIVADGHQRGIHLSQADLAEQLRAEGHSFANDRLRALAEVAGLSRAP